MENINNYSQTVALVDACGTIICKVAYDSEKHSGKEALEHLSYIEDFCPDETIVCSDITDEEYDKAVSVGGDFAVIVTTTEE